MKKLFVLLCLSAICIPAGAGIIMQPYLQAVTPGSVYVLAESTDQSIISVDFGSTTLYGRSASDESIFGTGNNTFVHRIKLAGLNPGTVYHYSVKGYDDAAFRTAAARGTAFKFAFMADCRSNTDVHNKIARQIAAADPAFSIYGGDLCDSQAYQDFNDGFFTKDELSLDAHVPFFLSPGNHEGWGLNTMAFTKAPDSASGSQAYYSFDYGDMHVLVLNTEQPYTQGSAQYAFASQDLAKSKRKWKVVACHKPAYCAGGHGEDAEMIKMSREIFEPDNVNAVLCGHSHFYQHNYINGIHHIVIGDAGAPQEKPERGAYTINAAQKYNYAVASVDASGFTINVYDETGAAIEAVSLSVPMEPVCCPADNLDGAYASPSTLDISTGARRIVFRNLTKIAQITVYSKSGSPVYSVKKDSKDNRFVWKVDKGMAAGTYSYTITPGKGVTAKGKIVILK